MLETDRAIENLQSLWEKMDCRIQLPETEDQFLSVRGMQASGISDQRQFPRYIYRNKAFLQHADQWAAIYAKDLSHSSIGFIHSAQLFPCEEVQICFINGIKVNVTIQRCRRLCRLCYDCGGHIEGKNRLTTKAMRNLIQAHNAAAMR